MSGRSLAVASDGVTVTTFAVTRRLVSSSLSAIRSTIAVVDSFGANTIRQDLATFDTGFGLTPMCGEGNLPEDSSGNCASGAPGPHFNIITVQGDPEAKPTGQGNGG